MHHKINLKNSFLKTKINELNICFENYYRKFENLEICIEK